MTATKRKTKGEKTLIKKLLISLAAGLGACLAVSLAGAVVAIKMGNALSLGTAVAAICVFAGAITSTALGAKQGGKALTGVYCGALFAGVLVLFSLCFGGDRAYPLPLFGAAAAGTLLGFLAFCFKKPNTKKKLKKYIKNA